MIAIAAKIGFGILVCSYLLLGIMSIAALIYFIFFADRNGYTNSDTGPR